MVGAALDWSQPVAASASASYDRDWGRFRAWCDERGLEAMPAEPRTLTRYLADLASPRSRPAGADDRPEDVVGARVVVADGLRPATIARYLASISVRHQAEAANEPNPAANAHVRAVLAGIRRDYADRPSTARPKRQKTAARTRAIRVLVGPDPAAHPDLHPGPEEPGYTRLLRDRALILIGWKAALRRSELAALDLGDIRVESDAAGHDGLTVTLDRSKTDQTATGATVWIAGAACTCATTAATTSTATTSTAATTGRPGEETSAVGEGRSSDLCPVSAWRTWTVHLAGQDPAVLRGPAWRPVDRHDHLRALQVGGPLDRRPDRHPRRSDGPGGALGRALPAARVRHRGLRPRQLRNRDHAPWPVAGRVDDARLPRRRHPHPHLQPVQQPRRLTLTRRAVHPARTLALTGR